MSRRVTGEYSVIAKRLLRIMKLKSINKATFYKEVGLSNGYIDTANNIGADKIAMIYEAYPDVNLIWLITGKGNPLNSSAAPASKKKAAKPAAKPKPAAKKKAPAKKTKKKATKKSK